MVARLDQGARAQELRSPRGLVRAEHHRPLLGRDVAGRRHAGAALRIPGPRPLKEGLAAERGHWGARASPDQSEDREERRDGILSGDDRRGHDSAPRAEPGSVSVRGEMAPKRRRRSRAARPLHARGARFDSRSLLPTQPLLVPVPRLSVLDGGQAVGNGGAARERRGPPAWNRVHPPEPRRRSREQAEDACQQAHDPPLPERPAGSPRCATNSGARRSAGWSGLHAGVG